MKNFYFALLFLCTTFTLSAQEETVNITFFVNTTGLTINEGGMLISGGFNNWTDMDLIENTDGNWFGTVALTPGTEVEYKFKNGPDVWEEGIMGDCVNGFGNRVLMVPSESQSLTLVGFNSCGAMAVAPPAAPSNLTFSVDMNSFDNEFNTVFVSGNFNGWSGDANPLADADGDGIWEGTIPLDNGTYEYKFTIDNWTFQEEFAGGEECTLTTDGFTNRLIEVGADAGVCFIWNACTACGEMPPPASTSNVAFSVDMNSFDNEFNTVFVSGNFNGWSGDANPLADADGDGIWEGTIPLDNGTYEYKFTIDNWTFQEEFAGGEECTLTTDGFTNRLIEVGEDTGVCFIWNTCTACGATPPPAGTSNVAFSVDMNSFDNAFNTVFVSGNFNGWSGDANPLSDADGDGIWEGTIPLDNGTYEYKFTIDNWTFQEEFAGGEECTLTTDGFTNRLIEVGEDTGVCFIWNTCTACGATPPPAGTSNVAFAVDMNGFENEFNTVFVSGNFNGWSGDSNPLSDADGDGIWEGTIPLDNGTYEYKFTIDNWTFQEEFAGGEECTLTTDGFTNRLIEVGEDTGVCFIWNDCMPCATATGPVDTFNVTFTVDMSLEVVEPEGMFLAGTFNGWTDSPMTDNGDNTWSYTGSFGEGDMLAYKFKNGPGGWEANEVRECTVEGTLGDRGHTVGGADEVLATVCFNSCFGCFTDVTFVVDPSQLEAIAPEGMFIAGSFNEWTDMAMTLDEATGLWSAAVTLSPDEVVEYKFKNGPDVWEDGITGTCTSDGGNRVLTVPGAGGALPAVCFNSCVGCNQATLTVTVDMNQETIAPEGIFIAGSFNGWTDGPMTDNGDGTYTASVVVDRNSTAEYKFKNGPDGWEMDFNGDCGIVNRMVAIADMDVTVPEVCFNECTSCTQPMVTFTVDMSEVEVAAEGVFLSGEFNEFGNMPMTDNGDGTWSATVQVAPRNDYEYKFKNGETFEDVPGACAFGFIGNRSVGVSNVDVTLPTVCFASCVGCGLVATTFTIDMSQENVDPGGARVAGTFSEWTDVLLTDVGNGIWSGIVGVMPNSTIEFKYKNGPDVWEEGIEGECVNAETGNRFLEIAEMDAAVAQTCFNSCEICMEEPDPEPLGETTLNIENSCWNDDGTLTIRFDLQFNCDNAVGSLVGMSEIGFHSGANSWSSVVEWDAEGAATAVNNGEDVFEVTIDPVAYYGLGSIDELDNIMLVFNQGPLFPDDPWSSEGKTDGAGSLDANCADIMILASELRNCSEIGGGGSETATSSVLLAAGSCVTEDGNVNITFDLADNCTEAVGSLVGLSEVGFHSGANDWSSVVDWDAEGAVTATNDGNDVFSVSIDPASYYGIALADLTNIFFVLNQGPAFPDDPWSSEAKAQGDGQCVDFNVTISEMPTCAAAPPVEPMVQDLPLTFDSDAIEYQTFGFGAPDGSSAIPVSVIDNPDASGENASSQVLSIEKVVGAQVWAGVAMPLASVIDFSGSPMLFATVWSPRAGVPFLLKVEDTNSAPDANGNPSVIAEVIGTTTTANAWEVLAFDMSTHSGFAIENRYNQVVFFPDFGTEGMGETFFVDNIGQSEMSTSTIDLVQENQFTIAPNPFNSETLVSWQNAANTTFQVSLLNVTGQVVRTYQNVQGESLRIAKDELVGGMYFLNFRDEAGNMGTMKLLIE